MDHSTGVSIVLTIYKFYTIIWPIFTWGFIIYILSSWIPGLRESSFGEMLGKVYEPLMEPLRKIIPPIGGMIDISPIFLIIIFQLFNYGMHHVFNALLNVVS